ncbi:hypothetical protein HL033_01890 [Neoehrlichia mikurensis]|uniref:Uncharacterized protein n=1 Tax=Neoehrlichia mikurensis TaxID=89586 RepID=A0A9Q9C1W5_9RICK|nr:hypothetical protein [Neoehrlichia mikurensis]QXK92283.1 hypothetical protein IAH97_01885 [Neoehrlichia mikurensis]QXK92737.1 hypothetical protein HUN61_01880 [Neoehrlichia mikurensis]QXK93978.1 hypothetical protein HL033_01890 [Neoehrlichia mikurensis]UTO55859.1 hypothetical protein LUA82_02225 [Neoehrlichia mikurensis]UTO56774.1 hypothetical protein LUA81_02205 [Neoehrlichia mikurensis]
MSNTNDVIKAKTNSKSNIKSTSGKSSTRSRTRTKVTAKNNNLDNEIKNVTKSQDNIIDNKDPHINEKLYDSNNHTVMNSHSNNFFKDLWDSVKSYFAQ